MQKIQEFVSFYENTFIPIYSDLVSYLGDKPLQTLIELENVNSHLIIYLKHPGNITGKENLEKAYNHLVRASLDAAKILWIEIDKSIEEMKLIEMVINSANISTGEFANQYASFKEKARIARNHEMSSVGINPESSINQYYEVIQAGWNLLKTKDHEKEKKWRKKSLKEIILDQTLGIIIGIVSSATVATGWYILEKNGFIDKLF